MLENSELEHDTEGGQNKCPKCGATDISLNEGKGILRCNFCRNEFEAEKAVDSVQDISKLEGKIVGLGAQNIPADAKDMLTFKCSSCGAEVIVDTSEAVGARCHWCRNTLSVNQQIPNGSIPDVVLPFKIKKEDAKAEIEKFVGKRKFFAHPKFKNEFTSQNVMGVYLPYMVVDVNAHAYLRGKGEHLVREYKVTTGSGDKKKEETRYDADLYSIKREFDVAIDDMTIEASSDKRINKSGKTNNIINSIMPFDTENAVKWDANYLKGYSSEKRDTNVEQLKGIVKTESMNIARRKAVSTIGYYDRGVSWENEKMDIKGQQWKAAYLPVWLYSYQQVKSKDKNNILHYVAVNARTKETMGSVPVHTPKLLITTLLILTLGILAMWYLYIFQSVDPVYLWLLSLPGIIYPVIKYSKYRNKGVRHDYTRETKSSMSSLEKSDILLKNLTGLKNSRIKGENSNRIGRITLPSRDELDELDGIY